jgi:hypothetical protein
LLDAHVGETPKKQILLIFKLAVLPEKYCKAVYFFLLAVGQDEERNTNVRQILRRQKF